MKAKSFRRNISMLYILTASNYIIGFISIPYLTRVLGPDSYGLIGFATAYYAYMQLFLDFGFILSSTASIAEAEGIKERIEVVLSSTLACKFVLIGCGCLITFAVCTLVPPFDSDPLLFFLYWLYAGVNALLPDFLYRGIEDMTPITLRAVGVKLAFLVGIFLFVKSPDDYHLVPIIYAAGSAVALVLVYYHMRNALGFWFRRVRIPEIVGTLRESAGFFVSRAASTFYSSLNTIVLGMIGTPSSTLGYYTSSLNCITAGRAFSKPIADSAYPYMVRTKDFRLLKKMVILGELVLIPITVTAFVFAEPLCVLLFGPEFEQSSSILRILLPLIPVALLSYLFGFPALVPLGLKEVANRSVIIGAFLQVIMLVILEAVGALNVFTLCSATLVTEGSVTAIRLVAYIRGRRLSA